ncbi:hypothetical protein LAZ67_3000530 [Cordylochernes scorpioides]|uniref:Uncharacterized protein n=1 Tax=Cordylochernes scorpioides TaxID=51811 RepID=A0ABY6K6G1_9ARAC|nr:hypothetical protein LAZ67_3000530 [Cordylochernes scorpioides]
MVRRWRSWFLEGRQNVHDDERSDRPVTATDNAAVAAVRNVVEANRRVTIDEIMIRLPPGIEIGCSSIGTIMSDLVIIAWWCLVHIEWGGAIAPLFSHISEFPVHGYRSGSGLTTPYFALQGSPLLVLLYGKEGYHCPVSQPHFRVHGYCNGSRHRTSPYRAVHIKAGVKIAKLILKKNQDPSLGLLEYRSTPLENGYSPTELLMGRKLRTTLSIASENLNPRLVDSQTLKRKEGRRRKDMKSGYDRRCGATDMEELSEGDTVWITDMRIWGIVKQKASTPRSYMVDTPVGTLRRNRFHLRKGVTVQYPADPSTPTFSGEELVENEKTPVVDYPSNDSEDGQIRTRSGRIVKPVDRLHY